MTNPPNRNLIQRTIVKSAKRVIVASGLSQSTRSGNKALEYLAKRLAEQCSMTGATQLGEELGEKVVALSHQMGKQHLDQGVIRLLALQKQLPNVASPADLPAAPAQAVAVQSKPSKPEPPEPKALAEPVSSQVLDQVPSTEVNADATVEVEAEDIALELLPEADQTEDEDEDEDEDEVATAVEPELDSAAESDVETAVDPADVEALADEPVEVGKAAEEVALELEEVEPEAELVEQIEAVELEAEAPVAETPAAEEEIEAEVEAKAEIADELPAAPSKPTP